MLLVIIVNPLTQCMVRPCAARDFRRSVGFAVLHQCIRPLIGACCAPGHHGYQRAHVLISCQASSGPFGSPDFACAVKTDPPSRLILSQTSAGIGIAVLCHRVFLVSAVPLFVPLRSFLRPGLQLLRAPRAGAVKTGRLGGHPQGLVLTAPSTVPRSCGLGLCRVCLDAFEFALLVENRPCNAGQLIGKRDR
jgi:hypothetical protein